MSTDYPGALDSYTTKTDGVDDVLASHINDLQDAVVAIETELGTQPRHTDTTAPTVNDDTGDGYSVGTIWLDTTNDRMYIAIDVSAGAAVWKEVAEIHGTWTPTITQSGSVAVTINRATYSIHHGRLCHVEVSLSVTAAGTAANAIVIGGQPAAIQPVGNGDAMSVIGVANVMDSGTAYYSGPVVALSAAGWQIYAHNGAAIGVSPNIALANGDAIGLKADYEIA
jgi:hypothetical protein